MEQYTAQSFWVEKKGIIENEVLKEDLEDNEVIIKTLYSGISYGTLKIVFESQVKNQYQFMRAHHQEGSFKSRVKYGYLNVGKH